MYVLTQLDEREGLPSASMVERLYLCPGSWHASRGIAEPSTPEMKAWAERGERIHLWLQSPSAITLAADEQDVAEACDTQRAALIAQIFGAESRTDTLRIYREQRFWLRSGEQKRLSGKVDFALLNDTTGLVVDYKTNRGDVTESPRNLQLRANAVMLWAEHGHQAQEVYVAIIQPLMGKPELCRYSREDLATAEQELLAVITEAMIPNALRFAGEKQCKFCPAKLKCDAAISRLQRLITMDKERLGGLSPQAMAELLEMCAIAKAIIKSAEATAKQYLKTQGEIPRWGLKPGANQREVTDAFGAFEVLFHAGLMDKDTYLRECVSVGIGDLERAVAKRNGLKAREAKEAVNNVMGAFLATRTKDVSLERTE